MKVGIARIVGVRSYHRNSVQRPRIQRQGLTESSERRVRICILQQHKRLKRGPQRDLVVPLSVNFLVSSLIVCLVGIIENPDKELHAQNVPNPLVNHRHRNCPFFHKFPQRKHITVR